jgi:transcriptional regulator with XRE-family HTH domain
VTEPSRPTFQRRKLGAKLRRLREEARLTLDEAAPKLDKTRSALQRIETGETRADVHLVRSMMDVYDRYDEGLLDEVREALKPPWYRAYGVKIHGYVDVETEAAQVSQFQLVDIPGLLQTESFMQALFASGHSRSPEQLNNDVAVRLIRQRRLTNEDRPLHLEAVVYEAALRREVGGPRVWREQLRHLVEMSELPTVTFRVVPLEDGAWLVPSGPFNLLTFPDPEDSAMLYIEHPTGPLHIEDAAKVQRARLLFDRLRTNALSPPESVALVEQLIGDRYGR